MACAGRSTWSAKQVTAAQHLGGGQSGAIGDEIRIDPASLDRPDSLTQPCHQRQSSANPQQGHRSVGVRADQAGQEDVVGQDGPVCIGILLAQPGGCRAR